MSIKAVLFDLDGTLLPLDQNEFINGYFKGLIQALLPLGIDPETLKTTVWQGTYAMIKNDGTKTNEEAFFSYFESVCKTDMDKFRTLADDYYATDYKRLIDITHPTPLAREAVRLAGANGRKVILATNPLFPEVAQHTRVCFAGLEPSDFELITTYESENRIQSIISPSARGSVCHPRSV